MKSLVRRLAVVAVAVGLSIGVTAVPAGADTSWGYVVGPGTSVGH